MDKLTERQAQHLRIVLEEQGMSQRDLCNELGFSPTTVNRWLKGKTRIRLDSAEMIHDRFPQYEVDWLQGTPGRAELLRDRYDSWEKHVERVIADFGTVVSNLESGGYSVRYVENGDNWEHGDNIMDRPAYYGFDTLLSKDGREVRISPEQWEYLRDEISAYTQMRVEQILERGCW